MSFVRKLLTENIDIPPTKETYERICQDMQTAIQQLALPTVSPRYRTDLIQVIAAAIDLSLTASKPSYSIDEVVINVANICSRVNMLLGYLTLNRRGIKCFALRRKSSGLLLASGFMSEIESQSYVANLSALGMATEDLEIIPAELIPQAISAPIAIAPPSQLPPALPVSQLSSSPNNPKV